MLVHYVPVVPSKAEFKLPERLLQDSHRIKIKGHRSLEMTMLKELSGNNPNKVLAEDPGAVRKSSCSRSSFRNCHNKEKNRFP